MQIDCQYPAKSEKITKIESQYPKYTWACAGVFWCVWVSTGVYGCVRVSTGVYGCVRVCSGVFGCVRVSTGVLGCVLVTLAISINSTVFYLNVILKKLPIVLKWCTSLAHIVKVISSSDLIYTSQKH